MGTGAPRRLRTTCPRCKQSYTPSAEELQQLFDTSGGGRDVKLYRSGGCDSCYDTGYRGRKAIYEILCVSPKIRRMIVDAESEDAIKQQAIIEGMKTLTKSGIAEVLDGATTLEELLRLVDVRAE